MAMAKIECRHWTPERGGTCALGRYGGRPSPGTCFRVCKLDAAPPKSRGLGDTVEKLAAAVGADRIAKVFTALTG